MHCLSFAVVLALSPGAGSAPLAEHVSAHFTFRYPPADAATIAATAGRVEREYARIGGDLGAKNMPRVQVVFYTDHAALEAATRPVAGVVPAWTYGLVTAADRIHCMSPNLAAWGPYERRMSDIVHEFAHGVTLHLNRRIANNPRWLWESVAIYEAGQQVDPRTLAYMTAHRPPSLTGLSAIGDTRIYEIGYTIAEFIVARWGKAALRDLVLHDGDTKSALGVPLADFESEWFTFVRTTYGI